jgi:hypothetical protein
VRYHTELVHDLANRRQAGSERVDRSFIVNVSRLFNLLR